MINTSLCDIISIKYPILQGGMAWISDASLACAVSNAGGLGIISAINYDIDWLKNEIKKAKQMTDKPFGVNIMLMHPQAGEVARMVIDEGVKVVTTGAGNPTKYMKDWLDASIAVIPVVPSCAIAKMVERSGATAVIAEGGEAGGHVGDITTMALVPQVYDAVNIPVIAAGGIADGRGVVAAFMLGAVGVQLGTRFLVAKECNISRVYKEKIIKAKDIDTIVTGKRLGHPVRSLKTPFSREFFAKEYDSSVSNQQLEAYGSGSLKAAAVDGDAVKGCFMCGQCAALIKKEQTAAEIIEEIFNQAEDVIKKGLQCIR